MVVFTVFFKRVADVRTGGVPYPLFSYVGLLSWTFFSGALAKGAVSITPEPDPAQQGVLPARGVPAGRRSRPRRSTSAIAVSILGVLFVDLPVHARSDAPCGSPR